MFIWNCAVVPKSFASRRAVSAVPARRQIAQYQEQERLVRGGIATGTVNA